MSGPVGAKASRLFSGTPGDASSAIRGFLEAKRLSYQERAESEGLGITLSCPPQEETLWATLNLRVTADTAYQSKVEVSFEPALAFGYFHSVWILAISVASALAALRVSSVLTDKNAGDFIPLGIIAGIHALYLFVVAGFNRQYRSNEQDLWVQVERGLGLNGRRVLESRKTPFSGQYGDALAWLPFIVTLPVLWARTGWWIWWIFFGQAGIAFLVEASVASVSSSPFGYWKAITVGLIANLRTGLLTPIMSYLVLLFLHTFLMVFRSNLNSLTASADAVFLQLHQAWTTVAVHLPDEMAGYGSIIDYQTAILRDVRELVVARSPELLLVPLLVFVGAFIYICLLWLRGLYCWRLLFRTPTHWREFLGEEIRLGLSPPVIEATAGNSWSLILLASVVWLVSSMFAGFALIISLNWVMFMVAGSGFSSSLVAPLAWVHSLPVYLLGSNAGWVVGDIISAGIISFPLAMAACLFAGLVMTTVGRIFRLVFRRCTDPAVRSFVSQCRFGKAVIVTWGSRTKPPESYVLDPLGLVAVIEIPDGTFQRLDGDEKRAVLAHELHHVQQDATTVSTLSLLSKSSLLGQALLTVMVDYPRREFEADQSAAKVTSPEIVISALKNLDIVLRIERQRSAIASGHGVSESAAIQRPGLISETWNFFFGSLIVGYAHPSFAAKLIPR